MKIVQPGQWCSLEDGIPQPGVRVRVLMGSGSIKSDVLIKSKYGYTFSDYSTKSTLGIKAWTPMHEPMQCSTVCFEYT